MEHTTHTFFDADAFEQYLDQHQNDENGFFIRFDKTKTTSSLTPEAALNIALSYGWIDGLFNKIDEQFYLKYFSPRRKKSIWSTKNKQLVQKLIDGHIIKPRGLAEVERAKNDGRWQQADTGPLDYSLEQFSEMIQKNPAAFANFSNMSPSIKRTYALSYYTLKKPESREKRLAVILERLKQNLKPM